MTKPASGRLFAAEHLHFYPGETFFCIAQFAGSSAAEVNKAPHAGMYPVVYLHHHRLPVAEIGDPQPGAQPHHVTGTGHILFIENFTTGRFTPVKFSGIETGLTVENFFGGSIDFTGTILRTGSRMKVTGSQQQTAGKNQRPVFTVQYRRHARIG